MAQRKIEMPMVKASETINTVRFYETRDDALAKTGLYMTKAMLAELGVEGDVEDLVITIEARKIDALKVHGKPAAERKADAQHAKEKDQQPAAA
jgi:hypothetical protein